MLDFIQRSEGLSLPEAIARLDGSPGLAPRAANRPAGPRQPPEAAALPPRDPNLLTAAARRSVSGTPGCSWRGGRNGSPARSSFPTSPAASSAGSWAGP